MKRIFAILALTALCGLLFAASALAAEVAQGKCLINDANQKVIQIEEYDINFDKEFPYGHPTGTQASFDVSKAMVGITPQPGDVLRIAYVIEGDKKLALKVMNVSKQDLRKK